MQNRSLVNVTVCKWSSCQMMQFSKQSHAYTHMHGVLRLFRIKWHFILDCMSIVVFFSVRSPFHFFFVSWHRCFLNVFFTNRKIAIVTIEWKSYEQKLFILFVHRFAYVHIWIHSSTKSWILFDLATDNEFFFWNEIYRELPNNTTISLITFIKCYI